jgi:hypothetical protein
MNQCRPWEFPRTNESIQECAARWRADGWRVTHLMRHDHYDNGQIVPVLESLSLVAAEGGQ